MASLNIAQSARRFGVVKILGTTCQINSRMIACRPDTIGEYRKSHIGDTAFTPTLSAEPFGSTFASR